MAEVLLNQLFGDKLLLTPEMPQGCGDSGAALIGTHISSPHEFVRDSLMSL